MVKLSQKLRKHRYRLSADLRFLLRSLLTILFLQQLLRVCLMLAYPSDTLYLPLPVIAEALFYGFRFDLMLSTWICIPMIIACAFPSGLRVRSLWRAWLSFMGLASIITGLVAISFYQIVGAEQGSSFYQWLANGEKLPWLALAQRWESVIWLMVAILFSGLLHELIRASDLSCRNIGRENNWKRLGVFFLLIVISAVAMRGTIYWGAPLKPEEAQFSSYQHANHLAANSSFTVIRTRMRMPDSDNSPQ